MSAREDRVNRELRALEAAYRHGQFDRAGYRARRRTLLSALRARDEITARNAIVPAGRRRTGAGGTSEAGSSILFDQGTTTPSRKLLLALLVGSAVLVVAIIWIASGDAHVR